ncbi:Brp/Blh family beta-carotene 15,15'-monooxygenase [Spirosoma lacussanchae]|uniref:Brp/Blh family beta-carotene 15,15'-dioxygenase n=1 Tax=Spirosoma lacussanchae TaxID=1884249 RepID=UPI001109981B|nr:Brp/Blh family beta-carotene 15,15'-dioxygenase [Spirosoma lacussanchae]
MAAFSFVRPRLIHRPASLLIAFGIILTGWQQLVGSIPDWAQWFVFGSLFIGAGIPHGALDHLISRQTALRTGHHFSWFRFLTRYLLLMAAYGLLWVFFPSFSLLLFLAGSAWHFGETDLENVPNTRLWTLTRFAMGGFVIGFILLTHATEVTPILERITYHHAMTLSVWNWAIHSAPQLWPFGVILTGGLFMLAHKQEPVLINWIRLSQMTIVLALGCWLPLLISFALYFGGWHALSSFQSIYIYLKHNQPNRLTASQLWIKSLPFTVLSLLGLAIFTGWWYSNAYQQDPLPVLFIFLSIITLPHLYALHGMNTLMNK